MSIEDCRFCGGKGTESAMLAGIRMVECRICMAMAPMSVWNHVAKAKPDDGRGGLDAYEIRKIIMKYNPDSDDYPSEVANEICAKFTCAVPSELEINHTLLQNASGCKDVNVHHGIGQIEKGCTMCWAQAIVALIRGKK